MSTNKVIEFLYTASISTYTDKFQANPRIKYDIDEIDEILDLYKKQLKKE